MKYTVFIITCIHFFVFICINTRKGVVITKYGIYSTYVFVYVINVQIFFYFLYYK